MSDTSSKPTTMDANQNVETSGRRVRSHGVLDVSNFKSVDDYISSLKRGPKRTMKVQIAKTFSEHGITAVTKPSAAALGFSHLKVSIAHQGRLYGNIKATFAGSFRFLVAWLMVGVIDEYRDRDGRLLAWCQMVGKGKTIRAMWYYADPAGDKFCIWFASVRLAVSRALALGMTHCDLGPSASDKVKELKKLYGFESLKHWASVCDYSGDFVNLATVNISPMPVAYAANVSCAVPKAHATKEARKLESLRKRVDTRDV